MLVGRHWNVKWSMERRKAFFRILRWEIINSPPLRLRFVEFLLCDFWKALHRWTRSREVSSNKRRVGKRACTADISGDRLSRFSVEEVSFFRCAISRFALPCGAEEIRALPSLRQSRGMMTALKVDRTSLNWQLNELTSHFLEAAFVRDNEESFNSHRKDVRHPQEFQQTVPDCVERYEVRRSCVLRPYEGCGEGDVMKPGK